MFKKVLSLYRKKVWSVEKLARFNGANIGENCRIQNVTFGSEPYLITIGNKVRLTNGVKIFTHGGADILRDKHPNIDFFGKVKIKDNVYVGNNSLIMPGVTIGSNVLVAAGSVVTRTIPDNVVVAGNPAKIISSIEDFEEKMIAKNVRSKGMSKIEKEKYLLSLSESSFFKK